ncbi:B-cell lymphoma/leukemia 11A-like [Gadus chalcogrammus]|uniref:B-cell lymphoma/leukemia 11A-like n=1 Tax=Gadus chalcogrammus TaxID=1042646 RepID=UPI0024C3697A|nr:B-cell lymphoma/leukemia 11A-like [Gadus chalcogrammus]
MSRRKQGKPQHLSKRDFTLEPVSGVLAEEELLDPPRLGEALKGDPDLLTCGQCHARFPLADILLFIQHKRRQCQGRLCNDKQAPDRPPASPHPQHPRRACHPVDAASQVSPYARDCLSVPTQGIIPKQEVMTDALRPRSGAPSYLYGSPVLGARRKCAAPDWPGSDAEEDVSNPALTPALRRSALGKCFP